MDFTGIKNFIKYIQSAEPTNQLTGDLWIDTSKSYLSIWKATPPWVEFFTYSPSVSAGDRGIFAGGWASGEKNTIDYITISTTGNALDFGDLLANMTEVSATSNGTNDRGVFGGGHDGSLFLNTIQYITISSTGNATDFGDLSVGKYEVAATSNGTNDRGVFGGGNRGWATGYTDVIEYITISSTGNATDFGDLTLARDDLSSTSNGTDERGVFAGGDRNNTNSNVIDYITINSTGNATDFGDLTAAKRELASTSNGINDRGVFGGGYTNTEIDVIEYITITSPGNATDFGDLTLAREDLAATSNATNERGVFAGGNNSGLSNVIDYITINNTGNASDFGDLTVSRRGLYGTSDGLS